MMLLRLFIQELSVSPWKLITIAGLAGLSNALVLAIINIAAEHATGLAGDDRAQNRAVHDIRAERRRTDGLCGGVEQ